MEVTEKTQTRVPVEMLETAREQWPETKDLSPGYVLRFALVYALTGNRAEALAATIDRRTYRQKKNNNP
jgi:hypothetical protein